MLQYFIKTAKDEEFTRILEPKEGCWVHVEEATIDDLLEIGKLIDMDYVDLQDALDKYEIPRIEKVNQNILIYTRYPSDLEIGLYTSTLTIILTSRYFITITPQISPFMRSFAQRKTKQSTIQRSKLMISLLLKIAQEFTSEIKKVRYNVLKQEKEMITVDSDDITSLTKSEEILNQYLSTLVPIGMMLKELISGKYNNFYEKDHEKLDDLFNAVKQSEDHCTNVLKSIRSLRDSYQIIFTNNLHKTIKLLTSLTIIFSIPTMIASLYGMNVELPLAQRAHSFLWIMIIIFTISAIGLWIFKRKRWL